MSGKFELRFKEVSRVFKESLKGVSRKIEGCFKGAFSGFKGYLREVSKVI